MVDYIQLKNALVTLMGAISPTIAVKQAVPEQKVIQGVSAGDDSEIADLLTRVQSQSEPLSRLIAESLAMARKRRNGSLETFCTHELSGWYNFEGPDEEPEHRAVQVYISWTAEINMQSWQWGGKGSSAWHHIKNDNENFKPVQLLFPQPISEIEGSIPDNPTEVLISMRMNLRDMFPRKDTPDVMVNVYGSGYTHKNIVDAVRQRLTRALLEMLPRVENT